MKVPGLHVFNFLLIIFICNMTTSLYGESQYNPPVAVTGAHYMGYEGIPITFDAGGSHDPDGTIVLYEWDWDGDGIFDADTTSPMITYTWTSVYIGSVILRVSDNDGLTSEDSAFIEVLASEPDIVNDFLTFEPVVSTFSTTADTYGCPEGFAEKFGFDAKLTNVSNSSIYQLVIEVVTLTDGTLLQNADGGPDGEGAKMTLLMVDGYAEGELSPGESVNVPLSLCLKQRGAFSFLLDIWGEAQ